MRSGTTSRPSSQSSAEIPSRSIAWTIRAVSPNPRAARTRPPRIAAIRTGPVSRASSVLAVRALAFFGLATRVNRPRSERTTYWGPFFGIHSTWDGRSCETISPEVQTGQRLDGADERGERLPQEDRQLRVRGDSGRIEGLAEQGHDDRSLLDEVAGHRPDRLPQRRLRVRGPRRGVKESDRFINEFLSADQPVQQVLQRARHPVGVLGDREEQAAGLPHPDPQLGHRGRLRVLQIGIEVRQVPEEPIKVDLDPRRCQESGGARERVIGGGGPKAAGDGEVFHARSLLWGPVAFVLSSAPSGAWRTVETSQSVSAQRRQANIVGTSPLPAPPSGKAW